MVGVKLPMLIFVSLARSSIFEVTESDFDPICNKLSDHMRDFVSKVGS